MIRATSSYWPFEIDNTERCVFWADYFNAGECELVKNFSTSQGLTSGQTVGGDTNNYRECGVYFISPLQMPWLFEKMQTAVVDLNNKFFNFDITGFGENLQFTEYRAPSGHYDFHVDCNPNGLQRKLTVIVQLSDESQYEGGDVVIQNNTPTGAILSKKQGIVQMFPSYTLHQVTPVTKGIRHSLVGWVTGPKFR